MTEYAPRPETDEANAAVTLASWSALNAALEHLAATLPHVTTEAAP